MRGDPSSQSREKARLSLFNQNTTSLHGAASLCFKLERLCWILCVSAVGTEAWDQWKADCSRGGTYEQISHQQLSRKSTSESAAPFQTLLTVLTADEDAVRQNGCRAWLFLSASHSKISCLTKLQIYFLPSHIHVTFQDQKKKKKSSKRQFNIISTCWDTFIKLG